MTPRERYEVLKERVRGGLMVRSDSRQVRPGEVFVAMPGPGEDFVGQALAAGAAHVVCREAALVPVRAGVQVHEHPQPRRALGELAACFFGTETLPFPVVGVTGTNGKTTVAYLLEHLLREAGKRVGVMGTVNYRWPGFAVEASLTTPDCWMLHELLANMKSAQVDALVMEVSSHALDQDRVAGLAYDVAVLTNITQDHLDYHGDMATYFRAKERLFGDYLKAGGVAVVNLDEPYGLQLFEKAPRAVGYALEADCPDLADAPRGAEASDAFGREGGPACLQGRVERMGGAGMELSQSFGRHSWKLSSPLVGAHNAANLLAAQAAGLALGLGPRKLKALEDFHGVVGRLERVHNSRGRHVFVDYAHTPDALDNVCRSLKALDFKRLVVVFGCGGDRDRAKRPLMGEVVCRHADLAVVTSDNPRHEDPMAIIEDIRPGLKGCAAVLVEPDRAKAIALALEELGDYDCLLVAGKGHETYQQVGDEKLAFSDQDTVARLLG